MNIFDYLNCINKKTKQLPFDKKEASPWMLMLWLSHSPDCIDVVNKINERFSLLPGQSVYNCLYYKIPKKNRFIKYTKGKRDKEKKELKRFRQKKGISNLEAKLFKDFL